MIYAMLTMVLLTFAVAVYLFLLRVNAVKKGEVRISYFRLNKDKAMPDRDVPDRLLQAARNYSNLFEVPTLFYVGCALTLALHLESAATLVLSWVFVGSRIVHSWIHLSYNNVLHRVKAFMLGNICVLLIWIMLVLQYAANQQPL